MKTLFLHPDSWDLMVDDYGNIAVADSPYCQAQDVASACRLWKGEARYNTARGIPYKESVLANLPPRSMIAAWYQAETESVPNVQDVSVVVDYDNRSRKLSGSISFKTNGETVSVNI